MLIDETVSTTDNVGSCINIVDGYIYIYIYN